jgi:hypothetical protein
MVTVQGHAPLIAVTDDLVSLVRAVLRLPPCWLQTLTLWHTHTRRCPRLVVQLIQVSVPTTAW